MARKKSAKKAKTKSEKRRLRNLQKKLAIKKALKEIKKLILEKRIDEAKKLLPKIYSLLDKAVKSGLMKENTASRKKSKIAKLFSNIKD